MQTLDLNQMQEDNLSQARDKVRRLLKKGEIWSRLGPDLISDSELLPYLSVTRPPKSVAQLLPFPILTERFQAWRGKEDIFTLLAQEKIRWSCPPGHKVAANVQKRVENLMLYYDPLLPLVGTKYTWIDFDPNHCPYRPLVETILPAFRNFATEASMPCPIGDAAGEAWFTPEADDFGTKLHFSTIVKDQDTLDISLSLTAKDVFWFKSYRLGLDRYNFLRQKIFHLIGARLEPWHSQTQKIGSYRGLIYRKPKKK